MCITWARMAWEIHKQKYALESRAMESQKQQINTVCAEGLKRMKIGKQTTVTQRNKQTTRTTRRVTAAT